MKPATNGMSVDSVYARRALERQSQLTKPPGSLGQLESVAVQLASTQQCERPQSRPASALLFASDHPVAELGVSAYPSSVTAAMVTNFVGGGAASAVFAKHLGVPLQVIDVGVATAYEGQAHGRCEASIGGEVGDLRNTDAMGHETLEAALAAGRDAVDGLQETRVLILGEMGIGNTTPAAALSAALLGLDAKDLVGPGTGVEGEALANKRELVAAALERCAQVSDPKELLRRLGGREIAAMAGAAMRAAEHGMTVLVDGFIVSASMLAAVHLSDELSQHLIFAHRSKEPGHQAVLDAMQGSALLDLDFRLGEGTGALCALPLLDLACAMHNEMATFEEAGVEGPAR